MKTDSSTAKGRSTRPAAQSHSLYEHPKAIPISPQNGTPTTNNEQTQLQIRIYCDGSGARPDGRGSRYAWLREDTGQTHVEAIDGLTNNEAEYKAIYSGVENAPTGSCVEILSDSELVINQLTGQYRVENCNLLDLRDAVLAVIQERSLTVKFLWIPRSRNHADKLIRKGKPQQGGPR